MCNALIFSSVGDVTSCSICCSGFGILVVLDFVPDIVLVTVVICAGVGAR